MHFLVTIWKEKNCRKHWKEQKLITKVMEFFLKGAKFGNKILEEKIDQFQKMKKLEKFLEEIIANQKLQKKIGNTICTPKNKKIKKYGIFLKGIKFGIKSSKFQKKSWRKLLKK